MTANSEKIPDSDTVHRLAVEPKHIKIDPVTKKLDFLLFKYGEKAWSVNWDKYISSVKMLHDLGVQLEEKIRENNPEAEYRGFCSAVAGKVRQIKEIPYYLTLYHQEEEDNKAHCHIELLKEKNTQRNDAIRMMMIDDVNELFADKFTTYKN